MNRGPYRHAPPAPAHDPYVRALSRLPALRGVWSERAPAPSGTSTGREASTLPRWVATILHVLLFVLALVVGYLLAALRGSA